MCSGRDKIWTVRQGKVCKALQGRLNSKTLLVLSGDGNGMIAFEQFPTSIDPSNPMLFLILAKCL